MGKKNLGDLRCWYKLEYDLGRWRHNYVIETSWGALELHVHEMDEETKKRHPDLSEPTGGIECHYRAPPGYMADRPPSHNRCWILDAPCWHDGSSLAASEKWIPMWQTRTSDQEILERLALAAPGYDLRKEGEER